MPQPRWHADPHRADDRILIEVVDAGGLHQAIVDLTWAEAPRENGLVVVLSRIVGHIGGTGTHQRRTPRYRSGGSACTRPWVTAFAREAQGVECGSAIPADLSHRTASGELSVERIFQKSKLVISR